MRVCRWLCVVWAALLPMTCLAQTPAASQAKTATLVVQPNWPKKPADVSWSSVTGITIDNQGQICLFNRNQPAVQFYRPDGALVRSWPTEHPKGAHCVKIDREGNLWLADYLRHVVQKYSADGKLRLTLGQAGQAGNDDKHFKGPTDTAILSNGDVFISDGYGNRRVVHFDKQGRYVKQWGEEGTEPGQFLLPHAIVADSRDRLYVADRNSARVQVFNATGKLLAVWKNLIMPWGMYVTKNDEIWVCGASPVKKTKGEGLQVAPPADQWIMKFNTEGKVLLRIPLAVIQAMPGKPGEVDWVHAIAVDRQGDLYLGDVQGKRAQKFQLRQP